MRFAFSSLVLLLALGSKAYADIEIIPKPGDDLRKVSKEYNIDLKTLMHKNNIINANISIENKKIIIPQGERPVTLTKDIYYKIKPGDTISKIAREYNITSHKIIKKNRLGSPSQIKAGDYLLIPVNAERKNSLGNRNLITNDYHELVTYHLISKGDSISKISNIHNVTKETIIELNKIADPGQIKIGTKLLLKKPSSRNKSSFKTYGNLKINWSQWEYADGNYITSAINPNKKNFFIAVNCIYKRLNNTDINGNWKEWVFPTQDFGFSLIKDVCSIVQNNTVN